MTAKRRLTAVVTVLGALAAAAPAHAVTHPYTGPSTAQSYAIALAATPGSPCAAGFTVHWRTLGMDPFTGTPESGQADGARMMPDGTMLPTTSCDISLDPESNADPMTACDHMVHEAKHLAGEGHAASGVMMADGSGQWPVCHVTTPRQDVIGLVFSALPRIRRFAWDVTCTPQTTRCKATSAGAVTRRYVVTDGRQGIEQVGV